MVEHGVGVGELGLTASGGVLDVDGGADAAAAAIAVESGAVDVELAVEDGDRRRLAAERNTALRDIVAVRGEGLRAV